VSGPLAQAELTTGEREGERERAEAMFTIKHMKLKHKTL